MNRASFWGMSDGGGHRKIWICLDSVWDSRKLPWLQSDAVSSQRGPCVVATMNKFTWTTEVLWRKGTTGPLSKWESAPPLPGQAFIAFLSTLHQGWSSFTMHRFALGDYLLQITKERMSLITTKKRMFANARGKVVELITLHPWEV